MYYLSTQVHHITCQVSFYSCYAIILVLLSQLDLAIAGCSRRCCSESQGLALGAYGFQSFDRDGRGQCTGHIHA